MLERRNAMQKTPMGAYDYSGPEQFSRFLRGCQQRSQAPRTTNSEHGMAQKGEPSLAMVYAVKQAWQSIYDPEIALLNGTIFEQLNKPFEMSGCSTNNGCRGANGGRMR